MSVRKDFEEFCRRTRPILRTNRRLSLDGKWGDYWDESTQGAWRAWQYLTKQNTPMAAKSVRTVTR